MNVITSWTARAVALVVLTVTAATFLSGSAAIQSVSPGDAQAELGQRLYALKCASCHGRERGGASGPALRGKTLFTKKRSATAMDFETWTRVNMPLSAPLSLSTDESRAITAWLLRQNKIYRDPAPLTLANARSVKLEGK